MIWRSMPCALFLVLTLVVGQGCALRFQTPARPQPVAESPQPQQNSNHTEKVVSAEKSSKNKCSDRVDGARVGSLTGTVLGTIVGAAFGMPWMGLAYKFAGSAIGFAASSSCRKNGVSEKNGKFVKPDDPTSQENVGSNGKLKDEGKPVLQPSRSIKEENI